MLTRCGSGSIGGWKSLGTSTLHTPPYYDPAEFPASTFVVEAEGHEIPPPLISFVRMLLLSHEDWEKVKEKQKPPKPKLTEGDGSRVLEVINQGLQRRLEEFPSSIEVFVSDGLRSSDVKLTYVQLQGRLGATLEAEPPAKGAECGDCSGR